MSNMGSICNNWNKMADSLQLNNPWIIILLSLPGHDVIVASARSIGIEFTWNYATISQKPGKVEKSRLEL